MSCRFLHALLRYLVIQYRRQPFMAQPVLLMTKYVLFFFVFSLCVVIPMWIFAPFLKVIRTEFLGAVLPLRILLLSLPVFFITSILQWVLVAKKQQRFLAIIYFASAISNILLNIAFIPKGSYIASSIITGVSEVGVCIALWVKLFRNK